MTPHRLTPEERSFFNAKGNIQKKEAHKNNLSEFPIKILSVTAEGYPKRREQRGKGGIKLDKNDCKPLFSIIDQMTDTSDRLRAEYFLGYQRGLEVLFLGVSDERIEEHFLLIDHSGGSSGDPYIDSYARGYRDGFEGMKPECPSLSSESSRSLHIASIV